MSRPALRMARVARQTRLSGLMRLAAVVGAQLRVGVGKQRDGRNAERDGLLGGGHREVDAQPLDARHRRHRHALVAALDDEDRPDQVGGRQRVLGHQPARPAGLAVAPHAHGGETARPSAAMRAAPPVRLSSPERRGATGFMGTPLRASREPPDPDQPGPQHGSLWPHCAEASAQGKRAPPLAYSQMVRPLRSAMSTWKWFLWALLASGPSTVPKILQAD